MSPFGVGRGVAYAAPFETIPHSLATSTKSTLSRISHEAGARSHVANLAVV